MISLTDAELELIRRIREIRSEFCEIEVRLFIQNNELIRAKVKNVEESWMLKSGRLDKPPSR